MGQMRPLTRLAADALARKARRARSTDWALHTGLVLVTNVPARQTLGTGRLLAGYQQVRAMIGLRAPELSH